MKNSRKSFGWKLLNSAWILLSFIGGAWIGFLIIGRKAKEPKWTKMGLIYAIALWGTLLIGVETPISNIGMCLYILTWMFSIVHSFIANKKFLICREILATTNQDELDKQKMKEKIIQHYKEEGIITSAPNPQQNVEDRNFVSNNVHDKEKMVAVRADNQSNNQEQCKLNINACTEKDLAILPGVSIVAAKKAIEYRNQQNGFKTVEEFYVIADIKPHFVIQLEDLITCESGILAQTQETAQMQKDESKGRILDL